MNVNWKETHLHSNNWVINDAHSFKTISHAFHQQVFYWIHSILCFLQVLCHITINHRFNINVFSNYKIREVKQYRYLQNPQLIFDLPKYTHNPCLTQCQSILLMLHHCMLTLFQEIQWLWVIKKIYKSQPLRNINFL